MKIDMTKLDIAMSRACVAASDLRDEFSPGTLSRIRNDADHEVTTKTAGRLARRLGVDVTEIMQEVKD